MCKLKNKGVIPFGTDLQTWEATPIENWLKKTSQNCYSNLLVCVPIFVVVSIIHLVRYKFFQTDWAFLGVLISIAFIVASSFWNIKLILVKRKMARHVENANKVFSDPKNSTSEEKFYRECAKFVIPYLHFRHVYVLGFAKVMKKWKNCLKT